MCNAEAGSKSDALEDMEGIAPLMPRGKKWPLRPRCAKRPLSTLVTHWNAQEESGTASFGNSPVAPAQTNMKRYSQQVLCTHWQKQTSRQDRSING